MPKGEKKSLPAGEKTSYLIRSKSSYRLQTINAMSSVVLPALLMAASGAAAGAGVDAARLPLTSVASDPGVMALLAYLALLFVLALLGSVVFSLGVSERRMLPGGVTLRDALTSWGMVLFGIVTLAALL